MVPSFTLRPPLPSDVESLAVLHVRCWREAYGHLLPEEFFTEERLESRRRLWAMLTASPTEAQQSAQPSQSAQTKPSQTIRVAEAAGEVVGFAGGGAPLDPEEASLGQNLSMLYLRQDFHGSGAGQALFDAVLPAGPAFLWVAKDNPRAQAFYRRNGFVLDGTEDVLEDFGGITEARMVRR
ncbi:ribosomal protein S18 acetylase RimI-like enzyme [Arthrobacter woluwensis]|uniref:GNAT family N-acetyltransferase n=1 Tax=Arthrobacter woluwensis TaxID=156980 RepID=UPI002783EB6A|nr:GNAT family N-acetyltransferase [Arthrobacter woluwensis]MDQ0708107.1 ribosomal protein S18 acetylase RimI-like enzyme [Arthrobacter woluwensis]